MDPENTVVLITGCSSGIGRALTNELAVRGCTVYASARREESIADLVGDNVKSVRIDVCDRESMRGSVEHVLANEGRIDVLINNAGYNQIAPLIDCSPENLRRQFETNIIGPFELVRLVTPSMIARKAGVIVNVGSVSGVMATPFAGAYCGSKAAMNVMTDSLRMELAPFGIDVVLVAPGAVESSMGDNAEANIEVAEDSVYAPIREAIVRRAQASQEDAGSVKTTAQDIADAVFADRRPTWVSTGVGAVRFPLMKRLLPTRLLDNKMTKMFGLDKLGG